MVQFFKDKILLQFARVTGSVTEPILDKTRQYKTVRPSLSLCDKLIYISKCHVAIEMV